MNQNIDQRVLVLETTTQSTQKLITELVNSQKENSRAIDMLLVKFKEHFAVEDEHDQQLKEYRDRHEKTLHELNGSVKQLNTQLASMPGLHDRTTRELLTPVYQRLRSAEEDASQHKLEAKKEFTDSESRIKGEIISIGKTYSYIATFLVAIIMIICGYLYLDLKHASVINSEHILKNIEELHHPDQNSDTK